MRTLKDEGTRKILVPYGFDKMRDELGAIITWHKEYRPHMTLKARTPKDVYDDVQPTPVSAVLPRSQAPPMKLTVSHWSQPPADLPSKQGRLTRSFSLPGLCVRSSRIVPTSGT